MFIQQSVFTLSTWVTDCISVGIIYCRVSHFCKLHCEKQLPCEFSLDAEHLGPDLADINAPI